MATRLVLHIGAPKTGTTFLQSVLFSNQSLLRRHGILVPGRKRSDHGDAATGFRQGSSGKRYADWQRLVAEIADWRGVAVVSNEWFSMASSNRIGEALAGLSDTEVRVVFTARDLIDQVPAAWQEVLKLGIGSSLDDFLSSLDASQGRWRWSVLDPAEVLEKWSPYVPANRIHVVTMPERGSSAEALWVRFSKACGIPEEICDTNVSFSRESLSAESARLLQLVGPLLREAIDAESSNWREPYRWIQQYISHELLAPLGGSRLTLREPDTMAVRERAKASAEELAIQGYRISGDLADLTSSVLPVGGRHPEDVDDSEVMHVALPLIAQLLGRVRQEVLRQQETV